MVTKNCERCKKEIQVRQADINRGWGRFCSKSCKAKKQYIEQGGRLRQDHDDLDNCGHILDSGYFGHGQS